MKNAKKSMFITTILMVAVLIVAVSTATFAWYTASGSGSASQANLVAAESSSANIAVGWESTASTTSVTFAETAAKVAPMCPTATPVIGTTTYTAMTFNTQSLNAAGQFNGNGDTNAKAWSVSDGAADTPKTSFFVINKNQNQEADVTMKINYLTPEGVTNANNDKLVVAVFGKQGAETESTLLGVFSNVDGGFVTGTIANGKTPLGENGCLTKVDSATENTPIVSQIVLKLKKANDVGAFVELSVYAWLDGTALTQEYASQTAAFSFSFNA